MDNKPKTALVLTTAPVQTVSFLLSSLRKHGYNVPLVVSAPGPNASLTQEHFASIGRRIASYLSEDDPTASPAQHPPPVLAVVSRSGQIEPLASAFRPDLVLSFAFPYPLGSRLLSSKPTFINLHTAPLPSLRGPNPHVWPILRPDAYPLDQFTVSWHYMDPEVDMGAIIKEEPVGLSAMDAATITARQLQDAAALAGLGVLEEVLELVKANFKGVAQTEITPLGTGHSGAARMLLDEERSITPDTTVAQALRLFRAIGHSELAPLIRLQNGLYVVKNMSEAIADKDLDVREEPGTWRRFGLTTLYNCTGGGLLLTLRKI